MKMLKRLRYKVENTKVNGMVYVKDHKPPQPVPIAFFVGLEANKDALSFCREKNKEESRQNAPVIDGRRCG
jgi:hypothetical protein